MGDSTKEEDPYESNSHEPSHGDYWNHGETDDSYESGYEESWFQDDYSLSDYGDDPGDVELDLEPPDQPYETTSRQSWYHEEDDPWSEDIDSLINSGDEPGGYEAYAESQYSIDDEGYGEEPRRDTEQGNYKDYKGDSWCEESETNQDHEELYGETDSQISLVESKHCGGEERQHESEPEASYGEESCYEEEESDHEQHEPCENSTNKEADYESQYIAFSGCSQSTEAYLRWEENMEANFQSYQVAKEEQLSYALDTLTGPANEWWEQEEADQNNYNEPVHTWESFKLESMKSL